LAEKDHHRFRRAHPSPRLPALPAVALNYKRKVGWHWIGPMTIEVSE
jgi:hypothetical protein